MARKVFSTVLVVFFLFCLSYSVFAACEDPDGLDYFTASGITDENATLIEDRCADWHTVVEMTCVDGQPEERLFYCEDKCEDGKCQVYVPVTYVCTDHDGEDFETPSYLTDNEGVRYDDHCQARGILVEMVCHEHGHAIEKYKRCPYGCENARCLDKETFECSDPDEMNIYLKSTTTSENGEELEDLCDTPEKLKEMVCEDGKAKIEYVECGLGCRNGACIGMNNPDVACETEKILCYNEYVMKCADSKWTYEECDSGCNDNGCIESASSLPEIEEVEEGPETALEPTPKPSPELIEEPDIIEESIEETINEEPPVEEQEVSNSKEESEVVLIEDNPSTDCFGCLTDYGDCFNPYETFSLNGVAKYCGSDGDIITQKDDGAPCMKEYECKSGLCTAGRCGEFMEVQKQSILKRFFMWVNRLVVG